MIEQMKNDLFARGASAARLCRAQGERTVSMHGAIRKSVSDINSAWTLIDKRFGTAADMPEACRWLLDNRYLALREAKAALSLLSRRVRLGVGSEGIVISVLCRGMLTATECRLSEDGIAEYLSGFQSVSPLPLKELRLIPCVLRAELIAAIAEVCRNLMHTSELDSAAVELSALFSSLRLVSELDMHSVITRTDPAEKSLMADPAGIYPRMDEQSRAIYRERLAYLARRKGIAEHELARKIADNCRIAEGSARHVGYALFDEPDEKRRAAAYIGANVLLTLILTLLCAFLSHSAVAAVLLLLPLSELTKSFIDYIILLSVPPRRLPRLELPDGVPDDGKTLCVISALLTDGDSGGHFAHLLEQFMLANRDCGKNLMFGILADLKEYDTQTAPQDEVILSEASSAVDALNAKYGGGFYLFTRARTLDTGRGKYSGFERKRGALLELCELLCGEGSRFSIRSGDADALRGARLILTLDSDTVPSPGSIKELIGAMLHPMNTPVLDTERGCVVRGHGLIHPRMCTSLPSASKTDFSRIFSGGGGLEPYGALCGEVGMDVFCRGGFSGKGIIDANALLVCSRMHLPSGRVLSHDALEGAYLRGGYMSDVEFSDSFPASPIAYFRRQHRWTRGDWQNAPWIFPRAADLPDIERWKLFDSLRRSLVPVAVFIAISAGLIFARHYLILAAWTALISLAAGLLISLTELASDRPEALYARYHSRVLGGIGASIVQTAFRLWFLPYEAWICASAAATALWRMLVSGKNLLEWETAAQGEGKKRGCLHFFKSMWLCPAAGAALIALSGGIFAKAVGLMWILAPAAGAALSLPSKNAAAPSQADRKYLTDCAREIWGYFDTLCSQADNFLPPDNFQEQPPVGTAHRTSPTNIGLALCSAMCAHSLGIITLSEAEGFIGRMLDSMDRLQRFGGHFCNWYDTRTLRALEPKYLSTVDCGNLCACLITIEPWLRSEGCTELADHTARLISEMDFSMFYCRKRGLMHIGIDLEKGTASTGVYDLMASEARLTSYIAIAKGDVPRRHWRRLSRTLRTMQGYRGMASWTGTMFEYLMPELFLPIVPDSLIAETARFCLLVQKKRRGRGGTWGISESAFYSLDPALNYRYKAHGCAHLALKRGQDKELVIAPYASFLALAVSPDAAIDNLHRLERQHMRGQYGFYEAIDFTPSRCRASGGETVRCFMVHHLGMSMLAIANFVNKNIVQKKFMSRPEMAAYSALLAERVPIGAQAVPLREGKGEKPRSPAGMQWEKRGDTVDFLAPECALLSNGVYNIMLTESGISRASCADMLVYRTPFRQLGQGHGLEIMLKRGDDALSLLPEAGSKSAFMWEFSEISCTYSGVFDDFTARCTIAAAGSDNGEVRTVELCAKGDIDHARLCLSFEPVMADASDYVNHPAYWRLGIEARHDGGCLMLHRLPRGKMADKWLCLACDKPMVSRAGEYAEDGFLSYPHVTAEVEISLRATERTSVRFALCAADTPEAAYSGAERMLTLSPGGCGAMVSACASLTGMTAKEIGGAMGWLRHLHYIEPGAQFPAKSSLWRGGLSGDLPIIVCTDEQDIASVTRQFCLIRSCGVYADLVFLTDEGGEYRRPVYSKVRETLASYGLEALLGTHAGVHILPTEFAEAVGRAAAYTVGAQEKKRRHSAAKALCAPNKRGDNAAVRYEYGDDGSFKFYVNQSLPARAWSNMLTNGRFGFIAADSGMGGMWLNNAREMRLTPWINDPAALHGPESLEYVTDSGRYSLFADYDGAPCRVSFGFGYASWEKSFGSSAIRCTAFVPNDVDARVFIIEQFGTPGGRLAWKCELLLSDNDNDQPAVVADYVDSVFVASSTRSAIRDLKFRAACSSEALRRTCDGFAALSGEFDESTGAFGYPVFAAEYELQPVTVLVCGCADESKILKLCKSSAAFSALKRTKAHWSGICSRVSVGGFGAADRYMGGWAVYQTLACRLLGRCSVYQSGGAMGFRDQLQDAVNLILLDPGLARAQILTCCRHQYLEGDVMHWWHSIGGADKGVRTHCSDDLLWLTWAVCEYVEKTGDVSICELSEYYVNSKPLSPEEADRYETPLRSDCSETVLSHASRALDCCLSRGVGGHGLLLFGGGDWNDGMNSVGGESVWLTWFCSCTARRFAEVLVELGKPDAEKYRAAAASLGKAADRAWDGAWYLRGYWPDGEALGSKMSECCRIDSIAQSWACFCPEATNTRADTALGSALRLLFDRENGIVKLFDPPFFASGRDPGYIQSYGPGFRENGGQYTHAALWLAQACFRRGRNDDGCAILRAILPANHDLHRYKAEPFVIPADVYTCPNHLGEAGWTWYTGSSGWYFRVFTEELLGLKLWHGQLYIHPKLPYAVPECRIRLRTMRGRTHEVSIRGDNILLDGEIYDGKGIPYA